MRKFTWATIFLVTIAVGVLAQELAHDGLPGVHIDQERTKWIAGVMRSIATIRPGMTRKDLSAVLVEDGGLQTPKQGRYVYVSCPFIKVDVEFSPTDDDHVFNPDDTVVRTSRPYLEYPISD
jgi:hypothetical protein